MNSIKGIGPREMENTVRNNQFWDDLKDFNDTLNIFTKLTKKLSGDCNPADVIYFWEKATREIEDSDSITSNETEALLEEMKQRKELFARPVHYMAYCLDPRYTVNANEDMLSKGERHLREYFGNQWNLNIKKTYRNFRQRRSAFNNSVRWDLDIDDCAVYPWQLLCNSNEFKELASFAVKILSIVASDAHIERTFCAVRRIHTWYRSRLSCDLLQKLIYIYLNKHFLND